MIHYVNSRWFIKVETPSDEFIGFHAGCRAGAKQVDVDVKQMKVTVTGYIEPKKVLKAAQATKKKVEMWPYVPVALEPYPYVSASYDKKAPPNMVRSVPNTVTITETVMDENYVRMFSDDNPYACSIM